MNTIDAQRGQDSPESILLKTLNNFDDDSLSSMRNEGELLTKLASIVSTDRIANKIANIFFARNVSMEEVVKAHFLLGLPMKSGNLSRYGMSAKLLVDVYYQETPSVTLSQLNVISKQLGVDLLEDLSFMDNANFSEEQKLNALLLDHFQKSFNPDELKDICFSLRIDWENLAGDGNMTRKIMELIVFCKKNNKLPELLRIAFPDKNSSSHGETRRTDSTPAMRADSSVDGHFGESSLTQLLRKEQLRLVERGDEFKISLQSKSTEEIFDEAIQNNFLPLAELKCILSRHAITVNDLKIWAHFLLKNSGKEGHAASYINIGNFGAFGLFAIDKVSQEVVDWARRHGALPTLKRQFFAMLAARKKIADGALTAFGSELNSQTYVCSYCGTPQVVPMSEGIGGSAVPTFSACAACNSNNFSSFEPAKEQKSLTPHFSIDRARQCLDASDFGSALKSYLVNESDFSLSDAYLWAARIKLYLKQKNSTETISKLPYEDIDGFRGSTLLDYILSVISLIERRGMNKRDVVDLLQAKPGNRLDGSDGYEKLQKRVCFCESCGDVFLQVVDAVGLTQVSDEPLYDEQTFVVNPPVCNNTECGSSKVRFTADFSDSMAGEFDELIEDPHNTSKLSRFIQKHFALQEMTNVIIFVTKNYDISFSAESATDGAIELVKWSQRREKIDQLFIELLQYKFESGIGGMSVAVQCAFCGTVCTTRYNQEGLVLLTFCPTCANPNKWKMYSGVDNVVAYDQRDNYFARAGDGASGVKPPDLYQNYIQSIDGNSADLTQLPELRHYTSLNNSEDEK